MPALKEAWWVCTDCHEPLAKIGKKGAHQLILDHQHSVHGPESVAGGVMRQVSQRRKK